MALIPTLLIAAIVFPLVGIGGSAEEQGPASPAGVSPLAGPRPEDRLVARGQGIELRLPISSERVTAIVLSDTAGPSGRELVPAEGIDLHDVTGGAAATALDVGAVAGTPVYSPIDGVISSVADYAVAGRVAGYEVTIEPLLPSPVAVRVTRLDSPIEDRPMIGSGVSAGRSVLGRVGDLSRVREQTVSQFTADAGNHIHLEVVATGIAPGT